VPPTQRGSDGAEHATRACCHRLCVSRKRQPLVEMHAQVFDRARLLNGDTVDE
jgi:hypothetical protein